MKLKATSPESKQNRWSNLYPSKKTTTETYLKFTKLQSDPKPNKILKNSSNDLNASYQFEGIQQYRHPDHVIRTSRKTERYSSGGKYMY